MGLEEVFHTFSHGPQMDGRAFVKLLKDNSIIDGKFTSTDADLIFAKVKGKGAGARKITFAEFLSALDLVAARKGMEGPDLRATIENSGGPVFHGTLAEPVRFHDDKSTYTGVHQYGGPSIVDKGRTAISDLSEVTDRAGYDIRGVPIHLKEHEVKKLPSKKKST